MAAVYKHVYLFTFSWMQERDITSDALHEVANWHFHCQITLLTL